MAVFRVERTRDYTVMCNHHLKDSNLSLKSKGLLSMMLSLPDEWNYTTRGLAMICKEGVDAIGKTLKELELAGYIIRRQLRGKDGRISDTEYTIFEKPRKPSPPDTTLPDTENPYLDTIETVVLLIRRYERWAKVYNLKQMAAALQFMQEQNITEYDQLSAKTEDAVSRFHALTEQLRRTEADLSATSELMGAVVRYAKTRPVFDGYKATKYSRKYLAEHEAELADYRAAKATMGELLGGEKLPKMAELKEKRRQLAARKKALYTEYRSAQEEMRQAVAVKANIDHLLGVTDGQRKKEQER